MCMQLGGKLHMHAISDACNVIKMGVNLLLWTKGMHLPECLKMHDLSLFFRFLTGTTFPLYIFLSTLYLQKVMAPEN